MVGSRRNGRQRTVNVRPAKQLHRLVQPPLAEKAPGANDVGHDIDGKRLAHYCTRHKCRRLKAGQRLLFRPPDVVPSRHPLPAGIEERHDIEARNQQAVLGPHRRREILARRGRQQRRNGRVNRRIGDPRPVARALVSLPSEPK